MLTMAINHPHFTCFFCRVQKFMEAEKSAANSLNRGLVIPYSRKLCNKNCIVSRSETLIVWSAFS